MDPLPNPCPHSHSELARLADLFPNSNQTISRTAAVSADAPSSNNLSAYRPSLLALTWPAIHTSDHLHWPTEPAAARFSSSVVRSPPSRATIKTIAQFGYHWIQTGVDFVSLDNASPDQFDDTQVSWIERTLARDETDGHVHTIVVGMHDALPDSISTGHGMNESAQMETSGRRIYQDLLAFRAKTNKYVYVPATRTFSSRMSTTTLVIKDRKRYCLAG
jgi:hypothetical protein